MHIFLSLVVLSAILANTYLLAPKSMNAIFETTA